MLQSYWPRYWFMNSFSLFSFTLPTLKFIFNISEIHLCYRNNVNLSLKCRYTLQYTYPYAYYMESGPRKKLVSSPAFYERIFKKNIDICTFWEFSSSLCLIRGVGAETSVVGFS